MESIFKNKERALRIIGTWESGKNITPGFKPGKIQVWQFKDFLIACSTPQEIREGSTQKIWDEFGIIDYNEEIDPENLQTLITKAKELVKNKFGS